MIPGVGMNPPTRTEQMPKRADPSMEATKNAAVSLPYRGDVDHGVARSFKPADLLDNDEVNDTETVGYAVELEPPEPVAVRIVNQASRQIRATRMFQVYVEPGNLRLIIGRHDARTRLVLHNLTGQSAYIGADPTQALSMHGFLVKNNDVELSAQTELYASAPSANSDNAIICVLEEYTIQLP